MKRLNFRTEKSKPVSVVIVTHNQSEVLRLQLLSLEKQKVKISFEVIVSDDGSSAKYANESMTLVRNSTLDISYTYQQHLGFRASRARNQGIRLSRGKILLFLDGDMIPDLYLVQRHFNMHNQMHQKVLVAGNRLRRQWYPISSSLAIEEVINLLKDQKITDKKLLDRQIKEEKKRKEFLTSDNPWRCCFSCNLSIPNNPETFFDERFVGWGPDDWQMVFRLVSQEDYKVLYNPRIIAYEMETAGESNVFRTGKNREIVQYLRNLFQFADECPVLSNKELFWGLRKIKLNLDRNRWEVKKTIDEENTDLDPLIEQARIWLRKNKVYP